MLSYENLLISITIIFCFYASYTDIRYGKIRNFCTFGLIYAGMLVQMIYLFAGHTSVGYLLGLVTGGGLIAFVAYWFGVLAPGDAKLFWGVLMILPPMVFQNIPAGAKLPPAVMAINIFTPYFLGATIYLVFKTKLSEKKRALLAVLNLNNLPKGILDIGFRFLYFLGFGYIISRLLYQAASLFGFQLGILGRLLIFIALFSVVSKLVTRYNLQKYQNYVILSVFLIIMLITAPSLSILFKSLATFAVVYIAVFVIGRPLILSLGSIAFSREVDVFDLREGMIPAEHIVKVEDSDGKIGYEKKETMFPNVLSSSVVVSPTTENLSKEKIEELKKLAADGRFEGFSNKIRIQQSMNFAPVILVGVILTVLCRGPFYVIFW